jgi:hypothetical protein
MTITSDRHHGASRPGKNPRMLRKFLPAAGFLLALAGCIPGPWDYKPEPLPLFRGITVTGYAVADRPVENLCFEKILSLSEASTEAFAFYDSAAVGLTGSYSTGDLSLTLTPHPNTPNCFVGPGTARFVRGKSYLLNATFVWDSAGTRTVTTLSATARVPTEFVISDTAHAPSLASLGIALENVTDPAVFSQLPPGPRALFVARYGDTLTALAGDSAGLVAWLAVNGLRMEAELLFWLEADQIKYRRGDSVFYLSRPARYSNLPHYFKATRGPSVKGVLISHRFDTLGSRPATSFDSLFNTSPDSSNFYFSGNIRRLAYYSDFILPDGKHNFDSMPVFNVWFWSGLNRLYFYGAEDIYADYQIALEEGGGNAKIKFPTNVTGGRGFFAGMIVDSFDVYIKLDSSTQAFAYPATRAFTCRDKGWFNTRDCIGYYPEYCAANNWTAPDCRNDVLYRALDPVDSLTLTPALRDSARAWGNWDPFLRESAERRYCIDKNYPAGINACIPVKAECENAQSGNGCQIMLWTRCQLGYWKLPACAEGLKSYCRAKRDVHLVMCRDVPED